MKSVGMGRWSRLSAVPMVLACAASVALIAGACGSGDSDGGDGAATSTRQRTATTKVAAPADATVADFCKAWNGQSTPDDADDETLINAMHDAATEMGKVGTPAGWSADERSGFEIFVEKVALLGPGDVRSLKSATDAPAIAKALGVTGTDGDKVVSFFGKAVGSC